MRRQGRRKINFLPPCSRCRIGLAFFETSFDVIIIRIAAVGKKEMPVYFSALFFVCSEK